MLTHVPIIIQLVLFRFTCSKFAEKYCTAKYFVLQYKVENILYIYYAKNSMRKNLKGELI